MQGCLIAKHLFFNNICKPMIKHVLLAIELIVNETLGSGNLLARQELFSSAAAMSGLMETLRKLTFRFVIFSSDSAMAPATRADKRRRPWPRA